MYGILDIQELVKRIIKYLIEGLMVAIVAMVVVKKPLDLEDILILGLTASASFSILDSFMPSMGVQMRQGASLGLGLSLVGF